MQSLLPGIILIYGSVNKKKAKPPWDGDFRLISEHWSTGVME
jgi:hypothetical protein